MQNDDTIQDELYDIETKDDIANILQQYGATKLSLPGYKGDDIFITDNFVIEWSGDDLYVTCEPKSAWLYDADLTSLFPDSEIEASNAFWNAPEILYHATSEKNAKNIMITGLQQIQKTRRAINQFVDGIFTSTEPESIYMYGSVIIEIDTVAMKNAGYTPPVSMEPDVFEQKLRYDLAHLIQYNEYYGDNIESDQYTIIVHGDIPAKFLSTETDLMERTEVNSDITLYCGVSNFNAGLMKISPRSIDLAMFSRQEDALSTAKKATKITQVSFGPKVRAKKLMNLKGFMDTLNRVNKLIDEHPGKDMSMLIKQREYYLEQLGEYKNYTQDELDYIFSFDETLRPVVLEVHIPAAETDQLEPTYDYMRNNKNHDWKDSLDQTGIVIFRGTIQPNWIQ